jgi:SAM-dependent methyltransferase
MAAEGSAADWLHWYDRWQRQQDCYVPGRLERFDLMADWPGFAADAPLDVLNLGCGPGSVAFRLLERYPLARVVGVDLDDVLLTMGREVARSRGAQVTFLEADIRDPRLWEPWDGAFDLIVTATALHWLGPGSLADTYGRARRALRPGGWLMVSDHVAADDPETQVRYRDLLRARQRAAFQATGADDWDGYWEALGRAIGQPDLRQRRERPDHWEGLDDGQPRRFHLEALAAAGFPRAEVVWQWLGEAVLAAQAAG